MEERARARIGVADHLANGFVDWHLDQSRKVHIFVQMPFTEVALAKDCDFSCSGGRGPRDDSR